MIGLYICVNKLLMQLIKAIIHISTINQGKAINRIYKLHAKIDKLIQSAKKICQWATVNRTFWCFNLAFVTLTWHNKTRTSIRTHDLNLPYDVTS